MADQGSGGRKKSGSASSVNVIMIVSLVWFMAIAGGLVILRVRGIISQEAFFLGLAAVALVAPLGMMLAWRTGEGSRALRRQQAHMRDLINSVETLVREGGLSEGAKRVIHRRDEREILRRAIEQDIADEDWDAAMVLVKELAERFGYRVDAEEFRARVERARLQTMDRNVVDELAGLDELIRRSAWPEAYAEAARIMRLYPESHRVDGLRARVDEARQRYRKDLERRFLLAAESEQLDSAIGLLKELDQYLTPTEAAPFQEVARGVIGKHKENLGVRFKLAVQDHQWEDAIAVGEQVMAEYPNTRMSQEVSELLPTLRERVGGVGGRQRQPAQGA